MEVLTVERSLVFSDYLSVVLLLYVLYMCDIERKTSREYLNLILMLSYKKRERNKKDIQAEMIIWTFA